MKKVMLLASEEVCDILRYSLDKKYITLPCSSPAACMELLSLDPVTLILDLSLSGYDSLAFLKECAGFLPRTIAITNFLSDDLSALLSELGVTFMIRKPFRPEYLQHILSSL